MVNNFLKTAQSILYILFILSSCQTIADTDHLNLHHKLIIEDFFKIIKNNTHPHAFMSNNEYIMQQLDTLLVNNIPVNDEFCILIGHASKYQIKFVENTVIFLLNCKERICVQDFIGWFQNIHYIQLFSQEYKNNIHFIAQHKHLKEIALAYKNLGFPDAQEVHLLWDKNPLYDNFHSFFQQMLRLQYIHEKNHRCTKMQKNQAYQKINMPHLLSLLYYIFEKKSIKFTPRFLLFLLKMNEQYPYSIKNIVIFYENTHNTFDLDDLDIFFQIFITPTGDVHDTLIREFSTCGNDQIVFTASCSKVNSILSMSAGQGFPKKHFVKKLMDYNLDNHIWSLCTQVFKTKGIPKKSVLDLWINTLQKHNALEVSTLRSVENTKKHLTQLHWNLEKEYYFYHLFSILKEKQIDIDPYLFALLPIENENIIPFCQKMEYFYSCQNASRITLQTYIHLFSNKYLCIHFLEIPDEEIKKIASNDYLNIIFNIYHGSGFPQMSAINTLMKSTQHYHKKTILKFSKIHEINEYIHQLNTFLIIWSFFKKRRNNKSNSKNYLASNFEKNYDIEKSTLPLFETMFSHNIVVDDNWNLILCLVQRNKYIVFCKKLILFFTNQKTPSLCQSLCKYVFLEKSRINDFIKLDEKQIKIAAQSIEPFMEKVRNKSEALRKKDMIFFFKHIAQHKPKNIFDKNKDHTPNDSLKNTKILGNIFKDKRIILPTHMTMYFSQRNLKNPSFLKKLDDTIFCVLKNRDTNIVHHSIEMVLAMFGIVNMFMENTLYSKKIIVNLFSYQAWTTEYGNFDCHLFHFISHMMQGLGFPTNDEVKNFLSNECLYINNKQLNYCLIYALSLLHHRKKIPPPKIVNQLSKIMPK